MKRLLSLALALLLVLPLFGCRQAEKTEESVEQPRRVGVSLAGGADPEVVALAEQFEQELTEAGFSPAVQCAEGSADTQIRQIEELITLDCKVIIVQAVDSLALLETEKTLKQKKIPLIACDTLLMDTPSLYGCVTYDYISIGEEVGNAIVSAKKLDKAKGVTIEFFMGAPENNSSLLFHQGVMNVLQPYLDSGALVCKSGQTAYEDTYCLEDQAQAAASCTHRLRDTYTQRKPLEICLAATDAIADGCRQSLEKAGYTRKTWPLITSVGGGEKAVQAVADGYQLLTVKKDPFLMARACADAAKAALAGEKFPADTTLDNHATDVPVMFLDTKFVDS